MYSYFINQVKCLNDINKSYCIFYYRTVEKIMIKILVIAVFNHTEVYDEFYKKNMMYLDILSHKRKQLMENVEYYYVKAEPDCTVPVLNESQRMITVPGTESWCPGILTKTLASFSFIHSRGTSFDYLVRTNASTFIDIEELYNELLQVHIAFSMEALDVKSKHKYIAMGHVSTVNGMNHGYGLNESTMQLYQNEKFFQGVCIIMNRALFEDVVHRARLSINCNIVDDVELGHFIFSYCRDADTNLNSPIHIVNLEKRMVSYYVGEQDAKRPFIFCNNRFKHSRETDINCFHNVADSYIKQLYSSHRQI